MATATERRPAPGTLAGRLAFGQVARGALIWGVVFAITVASAVFAYKSTYGTPAERETLLRGLTANSGIRALFGPARRVDTVGGFLAWRTLSLMPMVAGIWGLLATTRVLRGEEDRGRWETLLTAPVTRGGAALSVLGGFGAACGLLLVPTALAAVAAAVLPGDVSLGGALWLALALCIAAPAYGAVGALAAQLAPTRRTAAAIAGGVFAATFLVKVAADGSASLGWLRWLTPLGWIEELRPLTGPQPVALLPLLAWTGVLTVAAVRIASRRDLGGARLARSDRRAPHRAGLGSATGLALRESLAGLIGWALGLGITAFVFGFVSRAVADLARDSAGIRKHVESTMSARIDIASAQGYLSLVFVFLAVALSLYAVTHATAAREEEATGRLDTLLSQPLARERWLGGRILAAAGASALLALLIAVAAWAGAVIRGASVTLPDMLAASANMLPVVALFAGLALLGFALVPRHTGAIGFGMVGGAYLWEQTGAIVKAPEWVLAISPFHWLALVPSESVDWTASLVMLAAGALAALAAVRVFRRRDLAGL